MAHVLRALPQLCHLDVSLRARSDHPPDEASQVVLWLTAALKAICDLQQLQALTLQVGLPGEREQPESSAVRDMREHAYWQCSVALAHHLPLLSALTALTLLSLADILGQGPLLEEQYSSAADDDIPAESGHNIDSMCPASGSTVPEVAANAHARGEGERGEAHAPDLGAMSVVQLDYWKDSITDREQDGIVSAIGIKLSALCGATNLVRLSLPLIARLPGSAHPHLASWHTLCEALPSLERLQLILDGRGWLRLAPSDPNPLEPLLPALLLLRSCRYIELRAGSALTRQQVWTSESVQAMLCGGEVPSELLWPQGLPEALAGLPALQQAVVMPCEGDAWGARQRSLLRRFPAAAHGPSRHGVGLV